MLLLKNAPFRGRTLLPLRRLVIRSIALLGPYAGIAQIGDYSGEPIHGPVTPLEGIQAAIQNPKAIHYVP